MTVSTTSLMVAPCAAATCFTRSSGSDAVAKLRGASIWPLKAVRGPNARLRPKPAPPPFTQPGEGGRELGQLLDDLDALDAGRAHGRADEVGEARVFAAALRRGRDLARLRCEVEQRLRERHAGGAVERRVMDLGVQREVARLQPLDDVKGPQRPVARHALGVQAGDGGFELPLRAGLGQPDPVDVAIEVHLVRAHPDGIGEVERHLRELAREHRRQRQPPRDVALHVVHEVAAMALRKLQQVHRADVHGRGGRLQVQEQCVEPRQRLQAASPRVRRCNPVLTGW